MPELKTLSGKIIPSIGLGTFPFQGQVMADIVREAVKVGYCLIDTADDYRGEGGIGLAVVSGSFKRENVFLQTKISNDTAYADEPLAGKYFNNYSQVMKRHSVMEIVREKVATSLREIKTDYLDSLLIHYPYPGFFEDIWDTMIKLQKEGVVRYIGVSNFHRRHIDVIKKLGKSPNINEIYISPIGTKQEQIEYSKESDIQLMSYSPLMDISYNRIQREEFADIMDKYHKSLSQIILRWNVDRGCIPIPKTKNINRLRENFDIFDFSLTEEEIARISSLNVDFQILPESKICPGI
jgi:diketogulonate reductase-like aldo/keto reductase